VLSIGIRAILFIKEKDTLNIDEPKGDKITNSGSNNKRNDGKKKRCIKKIIYYDSDTSSSSPKDDNDDDSSTKKKTSNENYCFGYYHIPYNSNAHLLSIPLGKPPHFDGKTIHFGVIKCVAIYFVFILVFGK
jgi:hypothetical protein